MDFKNRVERLGGPLHTVFEIHCSVIGEKYLEVFFVVGCGYVGLVTGACLGSKQATT